MHVYKPAVSLNQNVPATTQDSEHVETVFSYIIKYFLEHINLYFKTSCIEKGLHNL